jgi:hypothetical protein
MPDRSLAAPVSPDELDLPADVAATLTQLLAEGADAAEDGDDDTVAAVVGTVESVTQNKVPPCALRERLLFGCEAVRGLLDDPDPTVATARAGVAAGYLRAMRERVADA